MKDKKIIIVTICIIIFVIVIYFLVRHLGMIDVKIPTGNVDIFDINFIEQNDNDDDIIYCNKNCPYCFNNRNNCLGNLNSDDNYQQNYNNNSCICFATTIGESNNESQTNSTSEQEENQQSESNGSLTVYDGETVYASNTQLKIFENKSYYVKDDLIAPESENSYQFVIRNNNDFAIIYSLEFVQTNLYNINMKYRLKQGGEYIVGNDENWVTASELLQKEIGLANDSYNVYTLDWKWFESDNDSDTKIGTNIEANYSLDINIFANRY